jgi:hypothetical protein
MKDYSKYANIVETMTIRHDSNAAEAHKPAVQPSQAKLFTLDEMIKRRAVELGDTILMGAPETGVDDFKEHSAVDIDRYADAAVQRLQRLGLEPVVSLVHEGIRIQLTE